jgi:26S proteasome regulatory subunit N10
MRLTQTNDVDELANSINNINICGDADLLTAIKIAQLSLKHRKNKSQRQRIVIFVGHPLNGSEDDFEDVGLRLKKNNVSIDVINFANPDNVSRLQTLVNTANKESDDAPTCHFLDVPAGCSSIMEVMIASPILMPEDMGGGNAGMGGAGAAAGGGLGFDPSMDPELAEAIRISMEEANAAQAQAQPAQPEAPVQPASTVQPGLAAANEDDGMYDDDMQDDDEKAFQEALALSMKPDAAADTKPEAKPEEPKPEA